MLLILKWTFFFFQFMYEHPEIFGPLPDDPQAKHHLEEMIPIVLWVCVVFFLFFLALESYFVLVVYSHYQNLRDELYGAGYNQGFVETGGRGCTKRLLS